jgi:two-component system sensor histidine kinase HydH
MSRSTLLFLILLFGAVASVLAGAYVLVQQDRAHLFEQFARERVRQVEEAVRNITGELDKIGEDLRFASELLAPGTPTDHERELRALVQVVGQYKAIAVFDPVGRRELYIAEPEQSWSESDVTGPLRHTALRALARGPGELETSPAFTENGWLRVFAMPLPTEPGAPRRAVAVLVDLEPYFDALRLITTEATSHLLVLGAYGRPTPATEPALAQGVLAMDGGSRALPDFSALVRRMRAGESGTHRLEPSESERLALGGEAVVVAFASVRPRGGAHWSVATLTSVAQLRSVEQAVVARLGIATAVVVLLLAAFGAWVVLASRRAVALRESRRHADRLAHLHEKSQKILDHVPTGVLALAADGRVSALNQPLRERLGADMVGRPLAEALPRAQPAVVERVLGLVEQACAQGRPRYLAGEALDLFGEPGRYNLHAVPLEHPDPDVRALVLIEDLSNLEALESQLLRAEKLATVGVLAAGIAHEIGTPLGVVRGRAEYLLGKLGAQSPHAPGARVIIEQIDRVSRTIRQLLDFARIQPPQARGVPAAQALRALEDLLGLEAERRKMTLVVTAPEHLPALAADPDQLQQVLVNLVMNALDACEAGATVRVEGIADPASGRVAIRVKDDGCGIPPERQNQVFDPFFTTKKRGQGTGLGLTIVAQIARNHGAEVELVSAPGKGTAFTLWWPVERSEEQHAVA